MDTALRIWSALEQLLKLFDSERMVGPRSGDQVQIVAAILLRQMSVYEELSDRRDYCHECESKALRLLSIARDPEIGWLKTTQALPGDVHVVAFGKDPCESPNVVNHVRSAGPLDELFTACESSDCMPRVAPRCGRIC